MSTPLTVAGGSIASLVLSLAAARRGRKVDLYLDPARAGGSFAGVLAGERRFDLGCRLFELDYEGAGARPLRCFDPLVDNHRPFIAEVAALIEDMLLEELQPAAEPEMWIQARRTRCVLMTVDLSALPATLDPTDRALICEQARQILSTESSTGKNYQTLEDASVAQHGARLHELLTEAVCAKQFAGWRQVLASERRKLWAALFHTQTIFEAFAGLPVGFQPHRPFFTTAAGVAYPFVERLYDALQASDKVTLHPRGALQSVTLVEPGCVTLDFSSGAAVRVQSQSCALGVAPEQLFRAAGSAYAPERISSSILWVDVAARDVLRVPSSLMVCDPAVPVLRIAGAGHTAEAQSFAVEFGSLPASLQAAAAALYETGCVTAGAAVTRVHQVAGPAQVAPTQANFDHYRAAQSALAKFDGVLLGGARRFGFESLNDQIMDGLYFGEALC